MREEELSKLKEQYKEMQSREAELTKKIEGHLLTEKELKAKIEKIEKDLLAKEKELLKV